MYKLISNMSKKRVQELESQNELLKSKIDSLEQDLEELNENTVISSMNEMKEQYEDLLNNSVCSHKFYSLESYYKRSMNIIKTVDTITGVLYDNVLSTLLFMDSNNCSNESIKKNTIKHNMNSIKDRLQLICEIISKDEDEWVDTQCVKCLDYRY